jgi:SAF domain
MSVVADGSGGTRTGSPPPPPPPPGGAAPSRDPLAAPSHRRRSGLPGPRGAEDLPARRRWGRFAAGACLALLGGWIFAALYLSAGARVDVLVAARDISPYQTLERDDLRVERVAADPGVATVDGADLDDMVGRVAAAGIPEGALFAPDHVYAEGERLVSGSEAIVGVEVSPAGAPAAGLETGVDLIVVVQPAQGGENVAQQVNGWLLEMGEPDEQTGERVMSVVVPRTSALEVGSAAADGRVALLVVGGG